MGQLEFPKSKLFSLDDLPVIDPAQSKIHIPRSFRSYNPILAQELKKRYPKIRFQEAAFDNEMWLILVEETPNVVLPLIMNGDNLIEAMADIDVLSAFTQPNFGFLPNVSNLSVLSVFADWRQDLPSRKPLPIDELRRLFGSEIDDKNAEYFSVVAAQASWSLAMARKMKSVAGVNQLISIDGHSHIASEQFRETGIEVANVTTAKLMIEVLRHNRLLEEHLCNIVVGVDFGNLALAHKLSQEEGFDLGIIRKKRVPGEIPGTSETYHELVYGDVRGKRVILMDDMIGSGGTILKTIKILLDAGAAEIIVGASHAVFAPREYYENLREVLANDKVKLVLVSDTLPLERPKRGGDKDLPYLPATAAREQKTVEMLPTDDYIAWLIGLMLTHPEMAVREKAMQPHVLTQEDPLLLFERITGKKISGPKIVAQYLEGGELRALSKKK
jgi:phosphoribosylpyrophosphate synthetase